MNEDDAKYKEVINILKGLPEVNAPKNFETVLMRRINSGTFKKGLSVWNQIFIPSKVFPSSALAIATIVILFVMKINSVEIDNPLIDVPRVREDVFANNEGISLESKAEEIPNKEKAKSFTQERTKSGQKKSLTKEDTNIAEHNVDKLLSKSNEAGVVIKTSTTTASLIDKRGLNFRQVNLNEEEKRIVNRLKERLKSLFKKSEN